MSLRRPPPAKLFLYGTLRDPDLFAAVAGVPIGRFDPRKAKATGVRAMRAESEAMPVIVRGSGVTCGLVLTNIDAQAWRRILFYESDDYALGAINLISNSGSRERARAFWFRRAMPISRHLWTLREWRRADKRGALAAARQFMEYITAPPEADLARIWRDIKAKVSV